MPLQIQVPAHERWERVPHFAQAQPQQRSVRLFRGIEVFLRAADIPKRHERD